MLGDKYDLAHVIGIVSDLAIDRLKHGMRLATDGDTVLHVFGPESFNCRENARPARLPPAHDVGPGGSRRKFEFLVTMAVGLLAVADEKINEAGAHIAGDMLHDDRDRIRFGVEGHEQILVL